MLLNIEILCLLDFQSLVPLLEPKGVAQLTHSSPTSSCVPMFSDKFNIYIVQAATCPSLMNQSVKTNLQLLQLVVYLWDLSLKMYMHVHLAAFNYLHIAIGTTVRD